MKTLILNGSPRIKGDTVSLINQLEKTILGEYKIVNTYSCNVSPCIDCRFCWENDGCAIQDEMQEMYRYIQDCDNIIIASPIYFSEITGKLLDWGSRFQTYFCARFFREKELVSKPKRGAVILVGGGDGRIDKAYETACTLLHHMNCHNIHPVVFSHNTNEKPAIEDESIHDGVNSIIRFLHSCQ